MSKLAFTFASAVVLFSAPVIAADLGVPRPAVPFVARAPIALWSGCYIGVSGGGTWGQSRHINRVGGIDTDITNDYDITGALVGPTVGCNIQTGGFVFGVEGDWSWTSKQGSAVDIAPFNPAFTSETRENWLATVRGRVGWAWDRWMFYVTGGGAFADVEARVIGPIGLGTISETLTRTGWTVGLGGEWAFSPNWSVKLEYLYVDFGKEEGYFDLAPVGFVNRAGGVPVTEHVIRGGINYRFSWGGPVLARY